MPPKRSIGRKRKGYNNWRDKQKQADAAGDDDTATAASEIVADDTDAVHEPSADEDAAHRAEPKKQLSRRQIQMQLHHQIRKASRVTKQNDELKQSVASLKQDVNDANSFIDREQRKHDREI